MFQGRMRWQRPINTEAEMRAFVPEPISKVRLKILDHLERHSQRMIAMSSLAVLSSGGAISIVTTRGRVVPDGDRRVRVDDPTVSLQGGVGGLFVIPGMEETLRINGRAAGGAIEIEEAYLQCPKAFIRSKLWDPATWSAQPGADDTTHAALTAPMRAFIARAPFGFICTESADGHGDVSPRGDPAGAFVRVLDDTTVLLPDRTGNQLADTLRNVLSVPRATLVLCIPGESDALELIARAQIIADDVLLLPSAVNGKPPKLGLILELTSARFRRGALTAVWNAGALVDPKQLPTMGEMILDQVNPNGRLLNKVGSAIFDLGNAFHKKRRLY